MAEPTIGSLFSGAGGLCELAAAPLLGGRVVWHCEQDPAASRVLAHHWPHTPNLGDITTVDWAAVAPVDALVGGFPCQDISSAGRREGITGARSGLWSHYVDAIRVLRPRLVLVENVSALVVRGLDRVLADLASLGFDAEWATLRASDVGAAHRRERIFITAADPGRSPLRQQPVAQSGRGSAPLAGHAGRPAPAHADRDQRAGERLQQRRRPAVDWRQYVDAIGRHELMTGRPAPAPSIPGKRGGVKLSPFFTEWLMGWPEGHVTAVPGLSANDMLRICGNGVVPQQAQAAYRHLLPLLDAGRWAA